MDCYFKIVVAPKMRIRLHFAAFDLEGSTQYCTYDYVEIRDGPFRGKFYPCYWILLFAKVLLMVSHSQ